MNVLILGASGFLGNRLYTLLKKSHRVFGTYKSKQSREFDLLHIDITDKASIENVFAEIKPDVVIHTVAISDPDFCEKYPKIAESLNTFGNKNIVAACEKYSAKLIYISSVYVFDGTKQSYTELDEPNPVNVYGQTKLIAENEVRRLKDSVILRCDMLYGFNNLISVNGFYDKILSNQEITLDDQQLRKPLWIDDVVRAIDFILERKLSGTYHLAQAETVTKYQLGKKLESTYRKNSIIKPGKESKKIAKRPKNSLLNTDKITEQGFRFCKFDIAIESIREAVQNEPLLQKKFCTQCKGPLTLHMGQSIYHHCNSCSTLFYPQPSIAVAGIVQYKDKILLIQRNEEPNKNSWTLPSGFIEYAEDPASALERELKEELGLSISGRPQLFFSKHGFENPNKVVLGLYYKVTANSQSIIKNSEINRYKWFRFDTLPKISFVANQSAVYKYLDEYVE